MSRGSDIERELVRFCWDNNCPAVRIPGSGGGNLRDLPDVIAKNDPKDFVMELKYTSSDYAYFESDEIRALNKFAEAWNGVPLLVVRFSHDVDFYCISTNSKQAKEESTDSGNISLKRKNKERYNSLKSILNGRDMENQWKKRLKDNNDDWLRYH